MRIQNRWLFFTAVLFSVQSAWSLEVKSIDDSHSFAQGLLLTEYKSPNSLSKTSKMKWYQLHGEYKKCAQTGEALSGNTSFSVWIPFVHLSCLKSWVAGNKKVKLSQALRSFKSIEVSKSLLLRSPFSGHREKLIEVFLDLARLSSEKQRNQFDSFVTRNSELVDYMDREQRAEYYKIMGEIAWLRQKNQIAKSNFLRSYSFQPSSTVLSRLKALKIDSLLRLDKYTQEFIESPDEVELWKKFSTASKKGQTYKVSQFGSRFLNQFPGSQRAEEVRNDMNTFYKRLLYRRGEKYQSSKRDYEKQLMKAPPQYIYFWAKEAYERGYQDSSFRLSEEAVSKWEGTANGAEALILAARSAFYLVKRAQAKKYLNVLLEKYSGHSAAQEAQYLLGLIYYREGEYKKVVNLYDRFLQSQGSDKWELQVRYWLYRSLKKIESSRSQEIAETLFKDFPLTYYGLRVRMEEKGGLQGLISQETKKVTTSHWWTGQDSARWSQVKKMLSAGWLDEAESEIDFMPDPQLAEGYLIRAKMWQSASLFNRAIKDYAEAININHDFLSRSFLAEAFPEKYSKEVKKAQKEFSMSKNLIWAIMRQESAFMERAISPSNAYGLMQLLSPTAKETAKWLKVKRFTMPYDIFKPQINIRFGTHFISRMARKYKNVFPLAIASYNVGPGNLDRWLSHRSDLREWEKIGASPDDDMWMDELPWAETSFYVKAVLRNYLLYKIIHEKTDQLSSPPWAEAKLSQ